MKNIPTDFLYVPDNSWGHIDTDDENMHDIFSEINKLVSPKNVIEIGMFAGHSTLLMMNIFDKLNSITSYDISEVSTENHNRIVERYPIHKFKQMPIWGDENSHQNIDLVFIDGDHDYDPVMQDTISAIKIKPRYILYDNLTSPGVRKATKEIFANTNLPLNIRHNGLWDKMFEPKYFFYISKYKTRISPVVMGLFKLQSN